MKKKIVILSVNILLLIFVYFIGEFTVWLCENIRMKKHGEFSYQAFPIPFHHKPSYPELTEKHFRYKVYNFTRQPNGLEYKEKRPIAVFGCSFAYGFRLEDKQTFSYKLSQATKRPVYNRAVNGFGIQHMLYQSRTSQMYDTINNPEYVIYVFIPDHFRRLYSVVAWGQNLLLRYFDLRYKFDGEKLIKTERPPFYQRFVLESYMYLRASTSYTNAFFLNPANREKYFDFALEHFKEAKEEMQKHWTNTRYIVLIYNHFENYEDFEYELNKLGYEVIYTPPFLDEDVYNEKYMKYGHPSEEAWNAIVPKLVSVLGLNK